MKFTDEAKSLIWEIVTEAEEAIKDGRFSDSPPDEFGVKPIDRLSGVREAADSFIKTADSMPQLESKVVKFKHLTGFAGRVVIVTSLFNTMTQLSKNEAQKNKLAADYGKLLGAINVLCGGFPTSGLTFPCKGTRPIC